MSKYFIENTNVLKNKLGITKESFLNAEEAELSSKALLQNVNSIRELPALDLNSLFVIHKIMFEDVYEWAGQKRIENISKGNKLFHPIEYFNNAENVIRQQLASASTFEEIIDIYADINHFHPFREGNGRSTRIYINLLLEQVIGKNIDWSELSPKEYMSLMVNDDREAMKSSFKSCLVEVNSETYLHDFKKNLIASYQYEEIYFSDDQLDEFEKTFPIIKNDVER